MKDLALPGASQSSAQEQTPVAFTPGPWRFSRTMRLVGNGVAAPWVCQVEDQGVGRARFEANSRLISAAPDLFAALQPLAECEIIDCDVPLRDSDSARYFISMGEIRAARRAIAKALGASTASPIGDRVSQEADKPDFPPSEGGEP